MPEPAPLREARLERDAALKEYGAAKVVADKAQDRFYQAQLRLEILLDEYAGQMSLPLEET